MNIQVTALHSYPVKSCAGIAHDQLTLTPTGPLLDRRWMLGSDEGGDVLAQVTQREIPRLALVKTAITDDSLILSAPDAADLIIPLQDRALSTSSIKIWSDVVQAHDEGDAASAWFSDFLNTGVRLVRMPDDYVRPVSKEYSPEPAQVSFSDGYPLLLISEASLEDLNERMAQRGAPALPMNRFRPNMVVSGCEPFAEDTWKRIIVAGVPFDIVKSCARCAITTVEQTRGEVLNKAEPLATLATFRKAPRGVMFGQNIVHRALGTLSVGDAVEIVS